MTTESSRNTAELVWVVLDHGTIEDVIAFRTYTDAARFAAINPENRSKPWRCPVQEYPRRSTETPQVGES